MKIHNLGNDYVNHYKLRQAEAYDESKVGRNAEAHAEDEDSRGEAEKRADIPAKESGEGADKPKEAQEVGKVCPDAAGRVPEKELSDRIPAVGRGKRTKTKNNG